MDSKSFRVCKPSTGSVRESRNGIFVETPSVMPEPDFVSGFDEGNITYDEFDDMVREARTYTSDLDCSSARAVDREVQDPSLWDLHQTIPETTNRDSAANRNGSDPLETPPASDDSPGGDSSASPEHGSPTGSSGRSKSDGSSGISASGAASRGGRGSRGGSISRGGRGAPGGRSGTAPGGGRGGSTPPHPTAR